MAKAFVVCPATGNTELIEFVNTPLGALIHACSRFRPATALTCGRACASTGRCDLAESSPTRPPHDASEIDHTRRHHTKKQHETRKPQRRRACHLENTSDDAEGHHEEREGAVVDLG